MVKVNPLFQIIHNKAAQLSNKPCVQTAGNTLHYNDVLAYINHFSATCKITNGSTLVVNISNPLMLYIFCFTALANNCNLVLLPATEQPTLLHKYVANISKAIVVTDIEVCRESSTLYVDALPDIGSLASTQIGFDITFDQTGWEERQIFFFSSGTTSTAKIIPTSYSQLLLALKCISNHNLMPYTQQQTVFITPPLYHSYGFSAMMEYSANGSTIVLPQERSFTGYLKTIANPGLSAIVTAVEGVPYYHEQLKLAIKRCKLTALQHIGFGGDAVPQALMEFYRSYKADIGFSIRYGLTEIPSVISLLYLQAGAPLQNNGGELVPFITCTGGTSDAAGEIWVSYNNSVVGTYGINNLSNVPLFTGDTGYVAGNALHITGRKKYLGKVRGFTVNTQVLEKFLQLQDDIEDAAVIIEHGELQVRIVAPALTADEIGVRIQHALPPQYAPGKIELVSSIERTETGKIIRHNAQTK